MLPAGDTEQQQRSFAENKRFGYAFVLYSFSNISCQQKVLMQKCEGIKGIKWPKRDVINSLVDLNQKKAKQEGGGGTVDMF